MSADVPVPQSSRERLPSTNPEVFDWRLHVLERGVEHLEGSIGEVSRDVTRHGVHIEEQRASIARVEAGQVRIESGIEKAAGAARQNMVAIIIALVTIVGAIFGSHLLLK